MAGRASLSEKPEAQAGDLSADEPQQDANSALPPVRWFGNISDHLLEFLLPPSRAAGKRTADEGQPVDRIA